MIRNKALYILRLLGLAKKVTFQGKPSKRKQSVYVTANWLGY